MRAPRRREPARLYFGVLPFVQPFVTLEVHRIGFEIQYTFVIVSVAASVRF